MLKSLGKKVATVLSTAVFIGCGGGGDDSTVKNDLTPTGGDTPVVQEYKPYNVSVIDDAVLGAKVEGIGCKPSVNQGDGNYTLECLESPKYIVANGGFVDVNGNGKQDANETNMGLPLILNAKSDGDLIVTPLTTLIANIQDEQELKELADKLGIDVSDFEKDLSSKNTELFQTLNALLVIASDSGITNQLLLMEKLRASIISSEKNSDTKVMLHTALEKMKSDPDLIKEFGTVFISGFIDESQTITSTQNILETLSKDYGSVADDKIIITGFIYDGIIKEANITILDGNTIVGNALGNAKGKWKITLNKTVLDTNKVLLFQGSAIDDNGDKIELKSAITTMYLRELAKQRINVQDTIDLIISNITTAQVAILTKKGDGSLPEADQLEEEKNKIELFDQDLLLEVSAVIKSIIDGNATIDADQDTYSFVVENLLVDENNETTFETVNQSVTKEIDQQSKAIKEDPILAQQLYSIEGENSLTPVLNKSLYSSSVVLTNGQLLKEYTKAIINNNQLTLSFYKLENNAWIKTDEEVHKGYIANNTFYFNGENDTPYAVVLVDTKSSYSVKMNKDYLFYTFNHKLYKPYNDMDMNIDNIEIYTESFDVVATLKDMKDSKIIGKLPTDFSSLSVKEQTVFLNNILIDKIEEREIVTSETNTTVVSDSNTSSETNNTTPSINTTTFQFPSVYYSDIRMDEEWSNNAPIEQYKANRFTLTADKKFQFDKLIFKEHTFMLRNNSNIDYVLKNGLWVEESNSSVTTVSTDNKTVTIDGVHQLSISENQNLEGQEIAIEDSPYTVTMPQGAIGSTMIHTVLSNNYGLDYETSYTTFSDVIQNHCGTNWFEDAKENSGMNGIAFRCNEENQTSGTLVGVNANGELVHNVGTWEKQILENSDIEAVLVNIFPEYNNHSDNPLFAMKDGKIWQGWYNTAGTQEELKLYNQIAFDAITQKLNEILNGQSVSLEAILTGEGEYEWDSYDNSSFYMYKVIDNKWVRSDYNTTSKQFELNNNYYDDDNWSEIYLENGEWIQYNYSEKDNDFYTLSFDESGNLIEEYKLNNGDYNEKWLYTAKAFPLTNQSISKDTNGDTLNGTFSEGAVKYIVSSERKGTGDFVPYYTLYYYNNSEENNNTNSNYEYHQENSYYHSFEEFISVNKKGSYMNSNHLDYSYPVSDTESKSGYISFLENHQIEFIDMSGTPSIGSYMIDNIDDKEILEFELQDKYHDEHNTSRGYLLDAEANNTISIVDISDGHIVNTIAYILAYNKKVPYLSIDEFITAHTYQQSLPLSLYFYNYELERSFSGYFNSNNQQLEFYENNGSKSNITGTYEIKTEGNTEILIIKPPMALQNSYDQNNTYTIYSMQEGKLRRGSYVYAPYNYDEDYNFWGSYNEIAIRDIISDVEQSTSNTSEGGMNKISQPISKTAQKNQPYIVPFQHFFKSITQLHQGER